MNKRISIRLLIGIFLCVVCLITACSRQSKGIISEQYEFDKDGRLIYRITPDGSKIKYKYNNLGLPIKVEYPDDTVKYGYDANGNRIWMQNSSGKTEYKYDAFDRLIEVVFKYSPEKRIRYEYDPWDRITGIKILENDRIDYYVKYEYNILGNLKSIDDGTGKIEYDYYPEKGEVVRHLPNGIRTAFSYSPAGELTSIKHSDKNNNLIVSYRYEYYPTGKISRVFEETSEGSKLTKYDWDSRGYLKTLQLPDGNRILYEYDELGNRISMTDSKETITYSYDKLGRCIKAGDIRYEWDDNGNLAKTIERGSKTDLRYDARNLPLLVKTPNETIKYKWDSDGHLISINAGKTISYFLPNPLSLSGYSLAEFDKLGRLKRSFLYGDSLMGWRDAIGNMHYYLEGVSNSTAKISDSEGFINQSTDVPLTEPIKFSKAGPKRESQPLQLFVREALAETPETVRVFNQVSMARRPEPTPESPPTPEPPPIPPIPPKLPVSNQGGKLDILVGGVTARADDLNRQAQKLGFDIGIPVNRNLDRAPVFVRGVFDSIWAAQEQVTGGFLFPNTKNNLYNDLLSAKHIGTLEVHSHGAITFGNLYKEIDKALGDKTISIDKVIFAGVYPHQKMVKVLEKRGVSYEIKTAMPYGTVAQYQGGYNDPIGLISMPNLTIGKSLMPDAHPIVQSVIGWVFGGSAKIGGLLSALPVWPGPYSFKAHELEYINEGKVERPGPSLNLPPKLTPPGLSTLEKKNKLKRTKKDDDDDDQNIQGSDKPPFCPWCDDQPPPPPPDSCPFPPCGGGGGGGSSSGRGWQFSDPFKSMEAKLGGIKLDATAKFTGNLGNITGAVYDPEKQVMVLISDEDVSLPSIKPEDLAVALMSVFGTVPQDPQFSLDPADPKKPSGEWLKAVYIPEQIIGGTEFGKALYEADWLLKQYAFGVRLDENKRLKERKSSVPGFKSTAELAYEEKDHENGKERWNRFWIVSEDMKLKQSGKSIYFESAKMRVKAKKQVPDKNSPTGLKDVDSEDDPVATKFAKGFTELYDEIAKESPEFERIRQLAKAVAIAKWMKQEGIPIDTNWVNEYANKRTDTVGKVTALSTQWEKTNKTPIQQGNQSGILTQIYRLHLFGGVDLTVKPKIVSDDGSAQGIQSEALAKLREKIVMPKFEIKHNGKFYNAIILPITASGQEIWKNSPITTADGTQYQFNKRGEVVKGIDSEGNITEYSWDDNKRLKEFKNTANNGVYITGKRKGDYSEITVTNLMKNKFLYRYNPAGYLYDISIEGQRYAAFDYKKDETIINYGNYQERLKFDNAGRVKRYEVYSSRDGAASGSPQTVDIGYDNYGNISVINSPDTGFVRFAYDNGKIRSIGTSRGKIDYFYEGQNDKIARINTTWGKVIKYDYEGKNLKQISYKSGDYHRDVIFKDDLPVEIKDNNGDVTSYRYSSSSLLEQIKDPAGETWEYSYNKKNRVETINLPDGSQIGFQYVLVHDRETDEDAVRKITMVHTEATSASSPIRQTESAQKSREDKIPKAVLSRIEDIKNAARDLKHGSIIDLFVEEKDVAYVNIAEAGGNVTWLEPDASIELKKLLKMTATTTGKIGKTLISRWQKFYDMHLSHLSKPILWKSPDGTIFKIKPVLIIKSNEVNYKYANLEKIPMLVDNFIVFIASKPKEAMDTSRTSAYDLVNRINNIPKLTNKNVSFVIRLPDMDKTEREKWHKEIGNLQKIIGKDNVLIDPSKEEFDRMLQNKGKDIILIEMTHTDKGILLNNDKRYTSRDVREGSDLSHIKYLISGLGTCNLPRLEDGRFAASLREKGVGIINASYKEVSSDVALKKLIELNVILRNLEKYDLYPYYLIDIINQKLGIPEEGTTNLGKIEFHRAYLFG